MDTLELEVDASVRELGKQLLADVDTLADRLVERIYEHEPLYAQRGAVVEDDLRASVRTNLERAVEALVGEIPPGQDWSDRAIVTGRRRARQGMPLEAVLRAYRLGGSIIWEAMVELARREHSGIDPESLLDAAGPIWRVIDGHSTHVSQAYRLEEARLRSRDLRRQQGLLDGLVAGRGADPAFARQAARTLGLPAQGPLMCVVALIDHPGSEPVRAPQEHLGAHGIASVWVVRGGAEFGLVDLTTSGPREVLRTLEARANGRVGAAVAREGLAGISQARRLAELAAQTLAEGTAGVAALSHRLPEALVANSPEIASQLLERTLGALLALPAAERDVLVDTVAAFLEHDGSPTRAAQDLYCHRNTVVYRMRRIEEITGCPLSTSRDKLVWALGLSAYRQGSQAPGA